MEKIESSSINSVSPNDEDESLWEVVIDFTETKPGGIAVEDLLLVL